MREEGVAAVQIEAATLVVRPQDVYAARALRELLINGGEAVPPEVEALASAQIPPEDVPAAPSDSHADHLTSNGPDPEPVTHVVPPAELLEQLADWARDLRRDFLELTRVETDLRISHFKVPHSEIEVPEMRRLAATLRSNFEAAMNDFLAWRSLVDAETWTAVTSDLTEAMRKFGDVGQGRHERAGETGEHGRTGTSPTASSRGDVSAESPVAWAESPETTTR